MAGYNTGLEDLPFRTLTDYSLASLFQNSEGRLIEILKDSGIDKLVRRASNPVIMSSLYESSCDYMGEDSFQSLLKHTKVKFSIYHQNIRSLSKHAGELWAYLECLNLKFDVIMLSEIGLKNVHIARSVFNDYKCIFKTPSDNIRGGVAIFIISTFTKYCICDDLDIVMNCNCKKCPVESLFIKLNVDEDYFLGCVYRHPNGNISHFTDALIQLNSKIPKSSPLITCGDFNIDLMKIWHTQIKSYTETLFELGLLPTITIPTRITEDTQTLIDHIYVRTSKKLNEKTIKTGVLFSDISDHLPTFFLISKINYVKEDRKVIRLYSEKNISKFTSDFEMIDWNNVLSSQDVDESYSVFIRQYTELFEKHFPLTKLSRARQKDKKWITQGIRKSIVHKNKLLQRKINRPTTYNINLFKTYNSHLQRCMTSAENLYYLDQFKQKHESNFKFWKTFNNVINPKRQRNSEWVSKLRYKDEIIRDNILISNTFNDFFSSIGEELNNKFPNETDFKKYLKFNSVESIYLYPIVTEEIRKEILNLSCKKSCGPDNLPARIIKCTANSVSEPLTHIFNLSIDQGIYPNLLKISKVIALFKKGDKMLPKNYRPISLLDIFDKIFEKLLHTRFVSFLNRIDAFFEFQFGFRAKHSTILALINIIDEIKDNIDNDKYTVGIFLDLTKAFDTVDHSILLQKLPYYGIIGKAHSLLESYLSNRKMYTTINSTTSQLKPIRFGVPQGSVLGPLLFSIYINDFMFCIPKKHSRLFADDTGIFDSDKCIYKAIRQCQSLLDKLSDWFKSNKLTVNVPKCACMIFHGKRKNVPSDIPILKLNGETIPRVFDFKYIGLNLDPTLSWSKQIVQICTKLNSFFGIFRYLRDKIPTHLKRQLYLTTASPMINYGIEIFGSAAKKYMGKLQSKQNQLLKVLYNKDWFYNTNLLHSQCKILKVADLHQLRILTFVRKCINKETIPLFHNYFNFLQENHDYETRNNLILRNVLSRTSTGETRIKSSGCILWNHMN